MPQFKILIFEDQTEWKDAFEFNLSPKMLVKGRDLKLLHRKDDATLMQDLEWIPDLIMVDFDLIHLTGEQIISSIDGDPNYNKIRIFFYSGGETIDSLRQIAKQFGCSINCFTKENDELENAILGLVI